MDAPSYTPADELIIHDVETIKVLADKQRLHMLDLMQQPVTVKEVAAVLETPATKLYYHVNLLLEHGLIRVVDQKLDTGIVEKVYQVTARQFKFTNPILMGDALPEQAATTIIDSMLEDTQTAFARAYRLRDEPAHHPPRYPFFSRKALRLSDEQLSAFHAKMDALIQEATALANANADTNEPEYEVAVIFYRQLQE